MITKYEREVVIAVESRDHFKNGVSPKDQMNKINNLIFLKMKKLFVTLLVGVIGFGFLSCKEKTCTCTTKIKLTDPNFVTNTDDIITEMEVMSKSQCQKFERVDTSFPHQIWTTTCQYH